ncbi:hypothetical protein C9975_03880 [Thalassospira xiamenensis]|nr:hypothetical protein C9975_03880 [Thalassospira xiamenensis]
MLCTVYKSLRKPDTYLYLKHGQDFSELPDGLLGSFGTPQQVMILNLAKHQKLAQLDVVTLRKHLEDPGYYLQIPPPVENLLDSLGDTSA